MEFARRKIVICGVGKREYVLEGIRKSDSSWGIKKQAYRRMAGFRPQHLDNK